MDEKTKAAYLQGVRDGYTNALMRERGLVSLDGKQSVNVASAIFKQYEAEAIAFAKELAEDLDRV